MSNVSHADGRTRRAKQENAYKPPASPRMGEELAIPQDGRAVIAEAAEQGVDVENIRFTQPLAGMTLTADGPEFHGCLFDGCRLLDMEIEGVFFVDVVFRDCDLSNLSMRGGVFIRCVFERCRLTGADLAEASLTDVTFLNCKGDYLGLAQARCKDVRFVGCELTEAGMQEMQLARTVFEGCRLQRAELFHTPLSGIDLTTDEIDGIRLEGSELKGAIVTPLQACELARLLGLIIR